MHGGGEVFPKERDTPHRPVDRSYYDKERKQHNMERMPQMIDPGRTEFLKSPGSDSVYPGYTEQFIYMP